ncbi:hypothetical protein MTO96_024615 [Rhipicephalus appendiculatus]
MESAKSEASERSSAVDLSRPLHVRTPLLESLPLSQIYGQRVYIKMDNVPAIGILQNQRNGRPLPGRTYEFSFEMDNARFSALVTAIFFNSSPLGTALGHESIKLAIQWLIGTESLASW